MTKEFHVHVLRKHFHSNFYLIPNQQHVAAVDAIPVALGGKSTLDRAGAFCDAIAAVEVPSAVRVVAAVAGGAAAAAVAAATEGTS